MLKIYLARHGQSEDNANHILGGLRDTPLTDLGVSQATLLAEKIHQAGLHFDVIYASPLQRAFKTAEIIAQALTMVPIKMQLLRERDFGVMTGKPDSSVEELCKPDTFKPANENFFYFLSPEGAETFPDLLERAKLVISEVQQKHKEGNILLVSHSDFGKMIYAQYYGLTSEQQWKDVLSTCHFGNSDLLLLSPDSTADDTHVFHID